MAVDLKHPLFLLRLPEWKQCRDTHGGEGPVKAAGFEYLPPTAGMALDGATPTAPTAGNPGWERYNSYRLRARVPEWHREAVAGLVGIMHRRDPTIELPAQLEPLRERATQEGHTLADLLRLVNAEQLLTGRLGLLGDVLTEGPRRGELYLSVYYAEAGINWDDETPPNAVGAERVLQLVVLDESGRERNGFQWDYVQRYRVLSLGSPTETDDVPTDGGSPGNGAPGSNPGGPGTEPPPPMPAGLSYQVTIYRETVDEGAGEPITPSIAGRTAAEIPFVFINAMDCCAEPEQSPTLPLSNLVLTYYRGDADYRHTLHQQGQDTLIVVGTMTNVKDGDPVRVGAGARIDVMVGGDAKYVGVSADGLTAQRTALADLEAVARNLSGKFTEVRAAESGDALRIRASAATATLVDVAKAGAMGLQEILRKLARWIGADPEAVKVTPNLDFADQTMTGDELGKIMAAKAAGAPMSTESVHALMAARGLTRLSYQDELDKLAEEAESLKDVLPQPGNGDPVDENGDPVDENGDPVEDPEDPPADEPAAGGGGAE